MKRPVSGKVLLVLLGLSSFGGGFVYLRFRAQFAELNSERASIAGMLMLIQAGVMLVPFLMILAAKRNKVGYWTGVISLALICCYRIASIIATLTEVGSEGVFLQALTMKVVTLLLIWLFLSFTFGAPSRAYYRMTVPPANRRTWGSKVPRPQRMGKNRGRWNSGGRFR